MPGLPDVRPEPALEPGIRGRPVRIVTDSTADIPTHLARALGIDILPCQVYLGEEEYDDGQGLSTEHFLTLAGNSKHWPRTAHPPLSQFSETYNRLLNDEQAEGIVSIHIAASLSGTVNAAWAAAQMLPDPSRVEVVDTGQLSMGAGWAAIEAARLANAGADRQLISHTVRALLGSLRVVAMIDTLDHLYRGGRISQVTAVLGSALRIKPLLAIQNGTVSVLGQVRTRARALQRLAAEVSAWGPVAELAVLHIGAEEAALELAEVLGDLTPEQGPLITSAGPAVATHLGRGAVGVCALLHRESVC